MKSTGDLWSHLEPARQFISKTTIAGRRLENHQSVKEELKTSATIGYCLVPSKTIIGLTFNIRHYNRKFMLALTERGDAASREYLDVLCI